MKYTISRGRAHERTIHIQLSFKAEEERSIVCLPAWRPGRYELGNFARNIRNWRVYDKNGIELTSVKISKDQWEVQAKAGEDVAVSFDFFAGELTGGSTWTDEDQLYVNPVNCLPFVMGQMDKPCEVELHIPDHYTIACSMERKSGNTLYAPDYHILADSPFIASDKLVHNQFLYEGIQFHLWFIGLEEPDWSKLLNDFFLFTHEQYELFRDFPVKEYHYLFQITPYKLHHGVEHHASTVIALGPAQGVMSGVGYNELLGVSSHELFHTWNVKAIRPVEMFPYDYSKENYSRLGYVYEGVTTYYGDLMLYRAHAFNDAEYFTAFQKQFQRHFDNPGRFNMPVAEASFDTWLDGYIPGIPNRKTNIYTEGSLVAFICDVLIRKHSNDTHSLDDVLRSLYEEFSKKDKGYSEADYRGLVDKFAGSSLAVFDDLVYGRNDYYPYLKECLAYLGLQLVKKPSGKRSEDLVGIRFNPAKPLQIVSVLPGSPADDAGLAPGDELVAIDQVKTEGDIEMLIQENVSVSWHYFRNHKLYETVMTPTNGKGYFKYLLQPLSEFLEEQRKHFASWSRNKFPVK